MRPNGGKERMEPDTQKEMTRPRHRTGRRGLMIQPGRADGSIELTHTQQQTLGRVTMSTDMAREYAERIAARIAADVEAGHPFGISEGYGDTPKGEPLTALDYLVDGLLSAEITRSLSGDYLGARLMIAAGGPNAWIDTRRGVLEVTWWSEPVTVQLPREFTAELDEAVEELDLC